MHKKYIFPLLATLFMAVVAIMFFYPDDIEGNVLQQHDIMQGIANGQEGKAYYEATGNTTRWTNSLFGGMPNFQIAPSYKAAPYLDVVWKIYTLGLPSPAGLLFAMMLGFFIMCLCLDMRWYTALLGAIGWGFSTYFIIIIGAGHIWKFVTLSYIPPTIGGIILCFKGKRLSGTALAALFGALQLQSNHPQMSYYFMFVIAAMVIGWLIEAIKAKEMPRWWKGLGCCVIAGTLALAANSASLYNSWQYSKETVRGVATEIPKDGTVATSGMSREAITAWSYGADETFTLLIPNVKGGASIKPVAGNNTIMSVSDTKKAQDLATTGQELQFMDQFPQYFGNQPMTNGPVYVGAFMLLLAILALVVCDGPMKWCLLGVSLLAILLSWGHNFQWFTDLFIDYFPGYSKFRTVSSILVIVEFTVPLLAVMCIHKFVKVDKFTMRDFKAAAIVMGCGAAICLFTALFPSIFGSGFSANETEQLREMGILYAPEYAEVFRHIREARLSLVRADAWRSLFFIIAGGAVLILWITGKIRKDWAAVCALSLILLVDLFTVNKRYVNSENFTEPVAEDVQFHKSAADEKILADTAMNYRVFDVGDFGGARSSYFHKTIGGYHAAKLTRYNDLITHQINKGNPAVLNMLNAKYFMNGNQVEINPDALGNAWFVDKLKYVDTPKEEMSTLDGLDTRSAAVADKKFAATLGSASTRQPGDTIFETTYAPDRLTYHAKTAKDAVAVFSEVFFPWGWTATIDGKEVPIGRVNYVLRAIRIPAGTHSIDFRFNPKSLEVTDNVSLAAVICIYLLCVASIVVLILHYVGKHKKESDKVEA